MRNVKKIIRRKLVWKFIADNGKKRDFKLKNYTICLLLILFLPTLTAAQDSLDFSDFEVADMSSVLLGQVDYSSYENGEAFREGLQAAAGKKANFAGKYYLYITGCGTMCQALLAVDLESSQIVDMVVASFGACFQKDSSLLITNPDIASIYDGELPPWAQSSYYQITETGFNLLQELKSDFPGVCESGQ